MLNLSQYESTGDYSKDCAAGRQFAALLINYIRQTKDVNMLNLEMLNIVKAGESCCKGVRIGFATALGIALL